MTDLMPWLGFVGTWLLVLGPLYQGALELLEQELDREGFGDLVEGLAPPVMPDRRWWLLPPVMLVLRRRRTAAFHRAVLDRMTGQQLASRSQLVRKATGWFVVAAGASLLAVKETWELAESREWPVPVFIAVLGVLFAGVIAGTVAGAVRQSR